MANSDYISRVLAKAEFTGNFRYAYPTALIHALIDTVPAADVRPVVRAHWYWDKDGMDWNIGAWRCSACKAMSPMWWNCDRGSPMHKSGHSFCPNCGADMREES